ncbi:P-type conjugative transfer ATPase TrbB [Pelagibius sp. Alg239-R121]|uniref:P-type conjugative transfer ATPase TrbB n=1 Tax=Pelagibius sp. Alg239-R121 TaxID=2993448 RepID=UPI0024A6A0D8|nr:P-type conjugative transfer ATPase TrbB [Pelagibius sp. Alg239-R121]
MRNQLSQDRVNLAFRDSLGPVIQAALSDTNVVEVMVNPDGRIWIDQIRGGRTDTGQLLDFPTTETIIRLVADHIGETVTQDAPLIAGTIPETGERFQGLLPPLTANPSFTIRKRPAVIFTLEDYQAAGIMSAEQAKILRRALEQRKNILIAGGTGTGKTTFVNALLAEPVFAKDRIVIIEDTAELQCIAEDQVKLLTKRSEPAVTMRDLVKTTLRLRPDRIIIGEIRDGSALDMLKAWNTGHPGGVGTVHANSAEDALYRIEDLIGEVSQTIPKRAIAQGIDLIVYMERDQIRSAGRVIRSIVSVEGIRDGNYEMVALGSLIAKL